MVSLRFQGIWPCPFVLALLGGTRSIAKATKMHGSTAFAQALENAQERCLSHARILGAEWSMSLLSVMRPANIDPRMSGSAKRGHSGGGQNREPKFVILGPGGPQKINALWGPEAPNLANSGFYLGHLVL